MWDETKKAAWSRAQLFAAAACRAPELPIHRTDDLVAQAAKLVDKVKAGVEQSTLTEEVTSPLLGVVEEVGPPSNRQKKVALLSGWAALTAAHQLGASVPVYALPTEVVSLLIEAKLYDPKGFLIDKPGAIKALIDLNQTIAAELLADHTDPIDIEAAPIAPLPVLPEAP